MQCPLCENVVLCDEKLVDNLAAKVCKQCQGRWVQSFQYWKWLDLHGDTLTEKPIECGADLEVNDSKAGKLCPECGRFLRHSKVGHGVDFCLDRCNNCGGIWFDKNEWEILVSRNLHDEVHFIFSAAWQKRIQEDEIKMTHEERIKKIVGEDDYAKLKSFAEWVNSSEHKNTMIGYLQHGAK
jgi:Zn-finger nucleic acid-binding protein